MDASVLDIFANISNCLAGVFLLSSVFKKKDNSAKALLALWTAVLLKKKEEKENAELNAALGKAQACLPELTQELAADKTPAVAAAAQVIADAQAAETSRAAEIAAIAPAAASATVVPEQKTVLKNKVRFVPTMTFLREQAREIA